MDMTYFLPLGENSIELAATTKLTCFLRHFAIELIIVIKKEAKFNVRKFRLRSQSALA